jgi:xanthine dehydrogenase accessory factor
LHLGTKSLIKFFEAHQNDDSLVLVSIISTEGSTYRKPGALMLISADDNYEGMISGGCLEGDLLHHAREVFASGIPKSVTYDMYAGDELVWGLGLGCDGIIHLLLQRLDKGAGFAVLEFIRQSLLRREPALLSLVSKSASLDLPAATAGLYSRDGLSLGHDELVQFCAGYCESGWPAWRQQLKSSGTTEVMLVNVLPPPRVLLCGAGPDVVPVAQQINELGWDCVIADHRPAFARADRFPGDCEVVLGRPHELGQNLQLNEVDAAVIMSHHLDNDAAYLRQLSQHGQADGLNYIGVLGPASRRNRLREMAQCPDQLVYGPVGLDIGAELPESIALAIVAEIHATLNARDGQSLTTGPVGGKV